MKTLRSLGHLRSVAAMKTLRSLGNYRLRERVYSSASNYVNNKGIVSVELVEISLRSELNPNAVMKESSYE